MFVAVGLVTLLNTTVELALGAVELLESLRASVPAVAVLTVQPLVAPSPVGCAMVLPVTEKPLGVTQVPLAVVHA